MIYLFLERFRKVNCFSLLFYVFSFFFVVFPVFTIIWYSFLVTEGNSLADNFVHVDRSNFLAILRSFWVSVLSIVFTFFISYLFSWFLMNVKSRFFRLFLIALVSVPLWSSFFVKLFGLKSFFDWLNGYENSTLGIIYVVVGLVYLNLPIMIISFYGSLSALPKNLINASLDLGNNEIETIYKAVIPYMKDSIVSSVFLVFVNSFTTVTVADFLNNQNSSKLIGQLFSSYSQNFSSDIDKSRVSVLTLFISIFILCIYCLIKFVPPLFKRVFDRNG